MPVLLFPHKGNMSFFQRGQKVSPMDKIHLTAQFKDASGNLIDTDSMPKISIVQPSGGVLVAPTSVGVFRTAPGTYAYTFQVPYVGPYGIWNDIWSGFIQGYRLETNLDFMVSHSQMPMAPNADGFVALGDDPGFNYSQCAIKNINVLIKMLKARLNSSGKAKIKDKYGNDMYVDCDIYSIDMLVSFLAMALEEFNQVPYFTFFTFEDEPFVSQYGAILVQFATIYAMASMSLLERGREYNMSDNGITFTPPTVSDLMNTQYSTELTNATEKLKYIKNSLRPAPLGLGTWSATSGGTNPYYNRLRHRRAGKIF